MFMSVCIVSLLLGASFASGFLIWVLLLRVLSRSTNGPEGVATD